MPELLELAQGWAAEDARRQSQFSEAELAAAADLLFGNGGDPRRRAERIRQCFATTTGSAALLTADVTARELQALYTHTPRVMENIVRVRRGIPTFGPVEAIRFDGLETTLPIVREGAEYGQISLEQSQTDTYKVIKYGALFQATEEALANDPVRVFETMPMRMARALIRTLEAFLSSLYFGADGPVDAFFDAQPSGVSSLPLSVENLRTAVGQMLAYTDPDGDPIVAQPKYLMVPPALQLLAMEILNSINLVYPVDTSGSGSGTPERMGTRNVLADLNIQLLVNPWIPSLVTSGTKGATSWALFTDPANIPAGEFGTLAGYDFPQVTVPDRGSSNAAWIQSDVLTWKVKSVFGGTTIDHRAGWASVGQ